MDNTPNFKLQAKLVSKPWLKNYSDFKRRKLTKRIKLKVEMIILLVIEMLQYSHDKTFLTIFFFFFFFCPVYQHL